MLFSLQFFTCRTETAPQDVVQLMKDHWLLTYPKVLISVHGDFPKRDYSWRNVMNESIIFTSGSSPSHQNLYNSSTIAIMSINTVKDREALYSKSNKVIMPLQLPNYGTYSMYYKVMMYSIVKYKLFDNLFSWILSVSKYLNIFLTVAEFI